MNKRSVFRVSYYRSGQPATAFICASSEQEAAVFVGVRDGSAQVSRVAGDVEVVGVDKAHPALPSAEVFKAPPESPKQLSDEELLKLRAILARG